MKKKEILILLNLIPGLGPRKIKALWDDFDNKEDILYFLKERYPKIKSGYRKIFQDFQEEMEKIHKYNIKTITWDDGDYPQDLKNIYDPPPVIYLKGRIKKDFKFAVVGSRRASYYGLDQARNFSYRLSLLGMGIVSGLARGIDTSSHQGALQASGSTYAVLGSGLLNIYPPENKDLALRIEEKGAVLSEFSLNTSPLGKNFPRRNRVISGLSRGVLVVEASRRSGALITADFALEQGKEVFSLPGNVNSPLSWGTLSLIKQGAKLVSSLEDIVEEFPKFLKKESLIEEQAMEKQKDGTPEERICSLLQEPLCVDEILQRAEISLRDLMPLLLRMRIKGIIKELPGSRYAKA